MSGYQLVNKKTEILILIKISIIGCGKIAGIIRDKSIQTHADAIKSNKNTKLISCFDIISSKSEKFSKTYSCKKEKSIEDLLTKTRPDVISLCTPDESHFNNKTNHCSTGGFKNLIC